MRSQRSATNITNHIASTQQFISSYVRNINSFTVDEFQYKLNTESWENIFEGFDTNITFKKVYYDEIIYKLKNKTKTTG